MVSARKREQQIIAEAKRLREQRVFTEEVAKEERRLISKRAKAQARVNVEESLTIGKKTVSQAQRGGRLRAGLTAGAKVARGFGRVGEEFAFAVTGKELISRKGKKKRK